jgi:kumamolisin
MRQTYIFGKRLENYCPGVGGYVTDRRSKVSLGRTRSVFVAVLVTATAFAMTTPVSSVAASVQSQARSLSLAAGVAISTPAPVSSGKAQQLGSVSAGQHLRLVLGLAVPHMAQEDAFVASLQDKNSPNFRHFLTAKQWNARFAPSAASQRTIANWARSQGLTITRLYSDRLVVDLSGTVGTIDKAFGVKIDKYRLGGKQYYSNNRSVTLPATISGIVQSVEGLNNIQRLKPATPGMHEASRVYSAGPAERASVAAHANGSRASLTKAEAASKAKLARLHADARHGITNGYYDPTDLYSDAAYSVNALYAHSHCCNPTGNSGSSPAASSIAISTVGNQAVSDVQGFQAQYPYLAYEFNELNIDGSPSCCDDEGTLDLEWSTSMANSFGSYTNTSHVWMYDGVNATLGTFTDIWNTMLSDSHARVMSSSWGCAESYCYDSGTMNTDHGIFNSMIAQGWTLMSASDDRGAYADCSHVSVEYPASDPDLLSAGGTDLYLGGSGGPFNNETAWVGGTGAGSCASNGGGGGGGCSVQWALPSYQSGRIQGLCSNRAEPDFSLNAGIGQNFYYNGALRGVGGTSIVSPELAGIWAQINSELDSFPSTACYGGCTTVGQANYDVWNSHAGTAGYNPFYDITSGCTTNDAGSGYCGITGYDRATGLGSADLFMLATSVLWWNVIEDSPPTISFTGPSTSTWVNSGSIGWNIVDNGSGAPTGVAGYTAQWGSDPGNPTSEPHGGSGNYFWDGPAVNASSGSVDVSSDGEGCHTLYVRSWDNIGESSVSTYGPVCYDGTAPNVGTGTAKFVTGTQMTNGLVPVKINWTGSDALSGINHYLLWESVDSAAYTQIGTPTATSQTVYLKPTHNYEFAIGAYDNAGNFGGYVFNPAFRLAITQETASTISYAGIWQSQSNSAFSGGAAEYTNKAQATATFSFNGGKVAWVGALNTNRGAATVSLDGGSPTTVNAYSSTNQPRTLLYTNTEAGGTHTLVVTNQATSGHPRTDVDAFLVIKAATS